MWENKISNQGGHQLGSMLSSAKAKALSVIADAVKSDLKNFMDSGIRSGLDALLVIALGADCEMLDRSIFIL